MSGMHPERSESLPTLRGFRTKLRHIRESDASALEAVFGDPGVAKFMDIPLLRDQNDVRELLDGIENGFRTKT
ncbi:MAG: hypothetical protein R3338_05535, partial [Thermoanaerobaculia bacterium]|nr:hypothetical protein [Thermoanaerobaculia bacterium]